MINTSSFEIPRRRFILSISIFRYFCSKLKALDDFSLSLTKDSWALSSTFAFLRLLASLGGFIFLVSSGKILCFLYNSTYFAFNSLNLESRSFSTFLSESLRESWCLIFSLILWIFNSNFSMYLASSLSKFCWASS